MVEVNKTCVLLLSVYLTIISLLLRVLLNTRRISGDGLHYISFSAGSMPYSLTSELIANGLCFHLKKKIKGRIDYMLEVNFVGVLGGTLVITKYYLFQNI